jgi:hypothetical protein
MLNVQTMDFEVDNIFQNANLQQKVLKSVLPGDFLGGFTDGQGKFNTCALLLSFSSQVTKFNLLSHSDSSTVQQPIK